MTGCDWLLERMKTAGATMMLARGRTRVSYDDLLESVDAWRIHLAKAGIPPSSVVAIEGEYDLASVSLFLALLADGHTSVPLASDAKTHHEDFVRIADVEFRIDVARGPAGLRATGHRPTHLLYSRLRERAHPGLVLFSSGSTGRPKAALHDLDALLKKFHTPRHAYRTLVFLQMDHIGGVNTLFYTLSNGGSVVVATDRSPASVAEAIATHGVELLPTSPTFLNLLLLSGESERWDLSSLKLITYGTEPMPASTLDKVNKAFPNAVLQQTYGSTEIGILRSKSRGPTSLWMRVGGEGFETKVSNGRLLIRAESAMLGYLNAPSPFDQEGFYDTGDLVETDGQWLRILGRDSDVINVGGSKVHPAEIESVLLQLDHVTDAVVYGEPHPMVGQLVSATVVLDHEETIRDFKVRMRQHCQTRLAAYKIPARVSLATGPLHSARFKRVRAAPIGRAS